MNKFAEALEIIGLDDKELEGKTSREILDHIAECNKVVYKMTVTTVEKTFLIKK